MPSAPNPEPDRKDADAPLPEMQPRLDAGTLPEVLGEIRTILRGLGERDGADAPLPGEGSGASPRNIPAPRKIGPARSLPEALYKQSLAALGLPSDGAIEKRPDPVPAALPEAAPPRRRNGPAVAALAVAGFVVLGAAGLAVTQGTKLAHRAASAAGQNRSQAGDAAKAAIRLALSPARIAPAAKSAAAPPLFAAAPKGTAGIRPKAPARPPEPRNPGTAAPRLPPVAQAPPAVVSGAANRLQTQSRKHAHEVSWTARSRARETSPARQSHRLRWHRVRYHHHFFARKHYRYRRLVRWRHHAPPKSRR
jgi:hypothetical protein